MYHKLCSKRLKMASNTLVNEIWLDVVVRSSQVIDLDIILTLEMVCPFKYIMPFNVIKANGFLNYHIHASSFFQALDGGKHHSEVLNAPFRYLRPA